MGGPEATSSGNSLVGQVAGVVDVFERREISGWLVAPEGASAIKVDIAINGDAVATTWATASSGRRADAEVLRFRFSVRDLWSYTSRQDRVSILAADQQLPISSKGMFYLPRADGARSVDALRKKLKQGYVFGQSGRLQLSKKKDVDWQRRVMGLYHRVNTALDARGYQSFLCYGSLLGAVREGGLIGHDLDFDCAYVSDCVDGRAAARELVDIAFDLIDGGFHVVGKRTCLAISDDESGGDKVDLFHVYFDESDEICFPFGVAGTSSFRREHLGELRSVEFAGSTALIPEGAERLVEHTYGETWRVPNPGFRWKTDRTRSARAGILREPQVEEIYWADFYSRASFTTGSSFADLVLAQSGIPESVVDFGCGDGRDAFAMARSGRSVVGLDRSHVGLRHAAAFALQQGLGDRARFELCDVNDLDRVRTMIEEQRQVAADRSVDGSLLFYLRFFLHSIAEDTQRGLFEALCDLGRPGDCLAAEFRTDRDEQNRKTHGGHYRRFQNAQEFASQLEDRYGFKIRVHQQGNGFSPYKGEDPDLYRVIAFRR